MADYPCPWLCEPLCPWCGDFHPWWPECPGLSPDEYLARHGGGRIFTPRRLR